MRIISGRFGGRRFSPPLKNWDTRPTTDRAKESVFNILQNSYSFEGKQVLDLFAGTGSMGLEFLSRGAERVVFVDRNRSCGQFIQKVSKELGILDQIRIINSKVEQFLAKENGTFDFIFVDPPYAIVNMPGVLALILESNLLREEGVLILEHDRRNDFQAHVALIDFRKYGDSHFSFFGGQ